jgi:hypothetical protein
MAGTRSGAAKRSLRPVEETKRIILEQIAAGQTVANACMVAGRTVKSYEQYRKSDPDFRAAADRLRMDGAFNRAEDDGEFPSFAEFSERYLGQRVFPHMQNVIDMIEGRDPSWTHPSMVFERGESDLAIVNMPPEHSKSTTITMNYVTYRIAKDPNIRVLIVSKTEGMAAKFLYGIKTRLTHPKYAEMHVKYGPPGGYQDKSESWSQKMIYISADSRDSGEKDPTVQALGVRGHIYGARADLIIMDDCVDLSNAHEYEKQIDWIQSEVVSRISASGMLLVVGTRLAAKDLYLELREPTRYPDETSPWSYLSMPAVLEFADKPEDWVTLWPKSNVPEPGAKGDMADPDPDGLYAKWDGIRLNKKRNRMQPRTWALVYMQQRVLEDSVFHPDAVRAAINGQRLAGVMPKGMAGCRPEGMEGLICVAGMDPAMAGFTAAVVIGLDISTQKRYVLDVHNKAQMTPDGIRELIKDWTGKYGIVEWRIEKNAFQSMLTQDREVREFLAGRGCILREHTTGTNKWDTDFGVASLSMLFAGWQDKVHLVELPSTHRSEATKALVEQLITWHPDAPKTQKTDAVMAFWFTELACRDRVQAFTGRGRQFANNPFLTPWDRQRQTVVSLLDYEAQGAWTPVA